MNVFKRLLILVFSVLSISSCTAFASWNVGDSIDPIYGQKKIYNISLKKYSESPTLIENLELNSYIDLPPLEYEGYSNKWSVVNGSSKSGHIFSGTKSFKELYTAAKQAKEDKYTVNINIDDKVSNVIKITIYLFEVTADIDDGYMKFEIPTIKLYNSDSTVHSGWQHNYVTVPSVITRQVPIFYAFNLPTIQFMNNTSGEQFDPNNVEFYGFEYNGTIYDINDYFDMSDPDSDLAQDLLDDKTISLIGWFKLIG